MLDANIKTQLKAYLEKLQKPTEKIKASAIGKKAPGQELL